MINKLKLSALIVLAVPSISGAVAISLASTTTGHRFYLNNGTTAVTNVGFIEVGTMTNESDASTFVSFGTAAIHGNAAFPDGLGNAALNTTNAATSSVKNQPIYILVYDSATLAGSLNAGIYKSSSVTYPADFAPDSVNGAAVSLATDPWIRIDPTQNWQFTTDGSFQAGGNTGTAGGIARTGNVFKLDAIVPEPSISVMLTAFIGALCFNRRRK